MAEHPIAIAQSGTRLTMTGPCSGESVSFLVNETATDEHFTLGACAAFRERVLRVWGPGGRRTTTPLATKTEDDDGMPTEPVAVPADRYDAAVDVDGVLCFARPRREWPEF